jgi:hypothetical protein
MTRPTRTSYLSRREPGVIVVYDASVRSGVILIPEGSEPPSQADALSVFESIDPGVLRVSIVTASGTLADFEREILPTAAVPSPHVVVH